MKTNLYSLIFLSFFFASCVTYKLNTGSENKKTITDIPLRPYSDKVDVYTNNDVPSVPYYKVQMVDVKSQVSLSYDELLKKLTKRAQEIGMDGIILSSKVNWTEQPGGLVLSSYYQNSSVSYQELSAIGLKYRDKMNYVDSIIKQSAIDFVSIGETHNYSFDFYGNVTGENEDSAKMPYEKYIAPFDIIQHMQRGIANWKYEKSYDLLTSFKYEELDTVWVSAMVDVESSPSFLKIHYTIRDKSTHKKSKYLLECLFDTKGNLRQKNLWEKNHLVWKEKIEYNGNKLTGFKRYELNGNEEKLILQSSNSFYSTADLPETKNIVASVK